MKCLVFLAVLAVFCSVLHSGQADECGKHEVYLQCGSQCPATCAQPNPGTCPTVCVAGCFCKPKYLRNSEGKCVKPEKCTGFFKKIKGWFKNLG
ncbi:predicted protein [Culex quinquefasciatus]|uniref:Predicted protein n=1 Tax=Culex quinquefasciatus TaxID=7176 RepID=B0XAY8_CULQU|nr:predicted protein [Culex quinquefasciatus]|eukprot:XP_001866810.1 predicted protein [Culex quinquefasciatus]